MQLSRWQQVFLLILGIAASVYSIVDPAEKVHEILYVKKAWESACPLMMSPALGRYKEENVENTAVAVAHKEYLKMEEEYLLNLNDEESFEEFLMRKLQLHENGQKIMENLRHLPIFDHFCNPSEFTLLPDNMEEPVTCAQVCLHCVPGSFPICYRKNSRFPGVARTCLCTYNTEDPLKHAAFALKSVPVPRAEGVHHPRHKGKSKRELLLSRIAKTILFL